MPKIKTSTKSEIARRADAGEDLQAIASELQLTIRTVRKYADQDALLRRAPLADRLSAETGRKLGNIRHALKPADASLVRWLFEQTPPGSTIAEMLVACAVDQHAETCGEADNA